MLRDLSIWTEGGGPFKKFDYEFIGTVDITTIKVNDMLTCGLDGFAKETLSVILANWDRYLGSLALQCENWQNIEFCAFRKVVRASEGYLEPCLRKLKARTSCCPVTIRGPRVRWREYQRKTAKFEQMITQPSESYDRISWNRRLGEKAEMCAIGHFAFSHL